MRNSIYVLILMILAFAAGSYVSKTEAPKTNVFVPEVVSPETPPVVPTPITQPEADKKEETKSEEPNKDSGKKKEEESEEESEKEPQREWWERCATVEPYYAQVPRIDFEDDGEESAEEYRAIRIRVSDCKTECNYNTPDDCVQSAFLTAENICMCALQDNPAGSWDSLSWLSVPASKMRRK